MQDSLTLSSADTLVESGGLALSATPAEVRMVTTHAQFLALAPDWDALVTRCNDQVFYRHGFVRLWLEQFAPGAQLRILTLIDCMGRLTAVLPLLAVRGRICGVPVRVLQCAANLHSCRYDLVADDPATAAAAFVAHLRQRRDWDVLRLIDVPVDGRAAALSGAARRAGLLAGDWLSQHSPYGVLPTSAAAFDAALPRRLRSSLGRRRRRLAQLGEVSIERYAGGGALAARLAEGLALEARGWKGRAGTAIQQDAATLAFYRGLAEYAARQGGLALWFLRLDGRAIAFDFNLEYRGRLLLLKTAYDEAFAKYSPGQLLLHEELRDAAERGLRECDFLGPSTQAKRDWTSLARAHHWIFLFRGARGRLVYWLKFHCAPWFKRAARAMRRGAGPAASNSREKS